jgi:hypothetical protein
VDVDRLPGGAAARIRLIVSDGINSTTADFGPFDIARKSDVAAAILSPAHDVVVPPGTLFLEGLGTDVDDGTLTGSALAWWSDLAGDLGTGELIEVDLASGRHRVTLTATDSDGNSTTASVNVLVAGAAPVVGLTTVALDLLPTTCVAATIAVSAAGLPASLVEYSLDGGTTWTTVDADRLPFRFIVPGSGFFHLIARAFDAAGQSTAAGEQFFTAAPCTQPVDTTPPEVTPMVAGTQGLAGWYTSAVTVSWIVDDPESGIAETTGCETVTITDDTPGVTLTCTATNGAGLSASGSLTIRIDTTPPSIAGLPTACTVWPPDGKLVEIGRVVAADAMSGLVPGSFAVTGTSSEPAIREPDIVIAPDGSGAIVVQVRAERLGSGTGRVYSLTATAADEAGNTATASAACLVPHDQGR